jgi:hypothetical protein
MIIAAILLTITTTHTVAQIKTEGNGTAVTPGNMTAEGGGENASITNDSGRISSSHPYCPLSFC